MLDKFITAIEPFAYGLIILAGMHLADWIQFTNGAIVGIVTVFAGTLLAINHVIQTVIKK